MSYRWKILLINCLMFSAKYFMHIQDESKIRTAYTSGAPEFTPSFQWGSCYSIISFMCMFCRSLFVLLYFFLPLCCLFFDFRILITLWYLQTLQQYHKLYRNEGGVSQQGKQLMTVTGKAYRAGRSKSSLE